jgi:hypothetical protein
MAFRNYDAQTGRFLTTDPLTGDPRQPLTYNTYAYAFNNPLRYQDALGLRPAQNLLGGGGPEAWQLRLDIDRLSMDPLDHLGLHAALQTLHFAELWYLITTGKHLLPPQLAATLLALELGLWLIDTIEPSGENLTGSGGTWALRGG